VSKGLVLVGAVVVALVMANGVNADEEGAQLVVKVQPAPARAPELTAYANDPEAGKELCVELKGVHPGMACHVEPAANSPHGTPWWLGNNGTSWSVG
jgi:hypothetical protein